MFRFLIVIGVSALTACSNAPMKSQASTQFAPCPSAPHCVSSLATDSKHIAAISVNSAQEWQRLQTTLLAMPRTEAVERQAQYLHAVSHSAIMRYKDDIELRYSPNENRVDVRSASRIGYYDFGVNRKRIEALREQFNAGHAP
ncbi:DUF1499 domain-containing protein [Zhongshania aliphaticivorans]|jgi:uncharacterized protein (DUF1499 family)|uniref:DUF1499 domain-containing protein n=1 Tax=Zhongshania aliphaticivorans TaxID=1470434 RepID=A0A127M779_9GAMM|nr:DUF1499 domain-containing protein [Zhongshania aliphaticivorans]AMO69104.1 hypothetical protein AZF00_12670 [Zhongshania aliphaticivorans]